MDLAKFLTAAAPFVLALLARTVSAVRQGPSWDHVERLTALRGHLPEGADSALDELLDQQVEALKTRDEARLYRKIDGSSVATIVVIFLVASGVSFLWQFDSIWLRLIVIAVDVVAFLLIAVGGATELFKDAREDKNK